MQGVLVYLELTIYINMVTKTPYAYLTDVGHAYVVEYKIVDIERLRAPFDIETIDLPPQYVIAEIHLINDKKVINR